MRKMLSCFKKRDNDRGCGWQGALKDGTRPELGITVTIDNILT